MFLHAGWLHILGNMIYLWVFGDNVENSMGHVRYLIFYLLCGLGANALEVATNVNGAAPGLGASGAIAGVLGRLPDAVSHESGPDADSNRDYLHTRSSSGLGSDWFLVCPATY